MKLIRLYLPIALAFILTNKSLAQITADFTADVTSGCKPLTVSFTNASTPTDGATYSWSFGDGTTSTETNPQKIFSTASTYTVRLTATRNSSSSTKTMTIKVYKLPTVGFSADVTIACVPQDVKFTNSTTVGDTTIKSWTWNFGDGVESSSQTPEHTYDAEGTYSVSLMATDNHNCSSSLVKTNYIDMANVPVVNFTANPTEACEIPYTVQFTNNSTVKGTPSYLWNAGGTLVSTDENASLTFTAYGTYEVKLTVTDNTYGCSTTSSLNYLVYQIDAVGTLTQGTTTINSSGSTICTGDISFSSSSIPTDGTVFWDFGDNSAIVTSTSGTHTYNNAGTYTVKLVASPETDCADTLKWTFTVEKVNPGFTESPESSCQFSSLVQFTNTSTNAISYLWTFNDGSTSTQTNPSITYSVDADADPYVVHTNTSFTTTLTANSTNGCTASISKTFTIKRPTALFSVDTISGCAPLSVTFTDRSMSDATISNRYWIFGDGETSALTTETTTTHSYSGAGSYDAQLIITNDSSCKDTSYTITINTGDTPTANFSVSPTTVCQDDVVTITDLSTPTGKIDYWEYWMNDILVPVCPSVQSPSFTFKPVTGTITIKQKVGYHGCYDETTQTITNKGPISDFVYEVIDCDAPYTYQFTDNSQGATSYYWDFGDGNTSTLQSLTHTFPSTSADYTVKLITSDATGCTNTMAQTVKVRKKYISFTTNAIGCINQTIDVDASGTNEVVTGCGETYIWNFNDSTSIIRTDDATLSHTYTERGTYRILLTILHENGCTDTISQSINIYGPYAVLKSDKTGGCPGVAITFTDSSYANTYPIQKWIMNYGDGNVDTTTSSPGTMDPYTYSLTNYYTTYIKVIDSKGCTDSSIIYIGVEKPDVAIAVDDPNSCSGKELTFTQSSEEIDSAVWSFGDGTYLRSTAEQVTHAYTAAGSYTVKLTAYKYGCSGSDQTSVSIEKGNSAFTDSISDCPTLVKFTHTAASSDITSGEWDLGDGTTQTYDPDAPYVYNKYDPGTYTVKLTVYTDINKCADSTVKTVVIPGPQATLSISSYNVCKGNTVTYTISDTADITSFSLDFGDNTSNSGSGLSLTHTYSSFGKKYVTLTIAYNTCTRTLTDSVYVEELTASFSVTDTSLCENSTVIFTNLSVGQTSQYWYLGPSRTYVDETPPDQTYSIGTYSVYLAVQNDSYCRDTARKELHVYADFDLTLSIDTSLCKQNKVQLKASGGSYVRWWPKEGLDDSTSFTPVATPESSTYYKAKSTRVPGYCSKTDSIMVYVPQGEFSLGGQTTTDTTLYLVIGDEISLQIVDTASIAAFVWTPVDGLSCTDCTDLTVIPTSTTIYYLVLTEPNGCLTDTLTLSVSINNADIAWKVPDAFRPGTSESNSYCMLHGKGIKEIVEFKIYNRWGNVVFSTTDMNSKGWDGKYQGKNQPIDSYVWIATVKLTTGVTEKKKGTVLLLR
jgi:gliding motility-associated-like protein